MNLDLHGIEGRSITTSVLAVQTVEVFNKQLANSMHDSQQTLVEVFLRIIRVLCGLRCFGNELQWMI